MPIRITCPGCQTELTLADTMHGKKVRCKSCDKVIGVPAASKKKVLAAGDDEEEAIQEEPKLQAKSKAKEVDVEDEADADEDQPKKKKKKKKKGKKGSMALIIGGVSVLVVLLLVGGGVGLIFALKPDGQQKKNQPVAQGVVPPVPPPQGNNNAAQFIPKIQEGPPVKKGMNGHLLGNIRSAAYITERKNDLGNIGKLFNTFAVEYSGTARSQEGFLEYIKTSGPIHKYVAEGYIVVNMKAEPLSSSSIIAYEAEAYNQGYLCVRGDNSVNFVTEANWKAALGK